MTPQSLQGCATSLLTLVEDKGTRAVGSLVGHDKSTVARWGADLSAWSAAAVLTLAAHAPQLRRSITEALCGQDGSDPATALVMTAEGMAGELLDGRTTVRDAADRLQRIDAALAQLKALRADYAALARGSAIFGRRSA